jgi:uncharacterized membrane protein YdbT with pleckstrin-like domain
MARGASGPAAVSKYLLPREVQVATVRMHPAILLPSAGWAVLGLLVAGLLSATILRDNHLLLAIVWLAWAVLLLRLIWKAVNWAVDYFVITSQRLMLTTGLLTRKVAMMPMSKVTDMSFQRSFAGRLLGYGELIVESAGQNQALDHVTYIPYPEQLYLLVCGILFPAGAEEPETSDEL